MENNKCIIWTEDGYNKVILTNDQIRLIEWLKKKEFDLDIIANCSDDTEWEEI